MKTNIISTLSIAMLLSFTSRASVYEEIGRYVEPESQPASLLDMTFYGEDDNFFLKLSDDHTKIEKFETRTGKLVETVFSTDHTRETTLNSIEGFQLSPEGSKILVWTDSKEQYRHSFSASYYFYEIRSRILRPLSTERSRQQAPLFSPDGRMIAYVWDNNIYVKKLDYLSDVAVTTDGERNKIINGIPDWTYQEEFATTQSMAWSPDNMVLCFLKYNETNVPTFSFPIYEGDCPALTQYALYPGLFEYKYPVAGEPNSVVTLHSYNIETRKILNLTLPDKQIEYIPRIHYSPDANSLLCVTLNRDQNRMDIYSVNPKSNVAKSLLVEQSDAWIDPASYEDLKYYADYFVIASSRTGFRHFYKYSYTGSLLGAVTSGEFDATVYYGCEAKTGAHYVQTTQTGPINRAIYRIDKQGRSTLISKAEGTSSARFSPNMSYYILNYSSATSAPTFTLFSTNQQKQVKVLEDNAAYQSKYADCPKAEFFTFDANGVTLYGSIIKPSSFNPSAKYPVIMNQYSGPGSQEVLNRWSVGWATYFAMKGYVVVTVDGRGTGGRGRKFMDVVYKQLGHYETIDQIAAANYAATLPYCDANRIGIYGWSFGGYETLMASSHPQAPYAAAVAVAPVADWRFYDTIYTERYMLTPQQNALGYDKTSAIGIASDRRCPLLIISGTADDNVHFYNTLRYMTALESQGLWADMMAVPNANHSIRGCGKRSLVYARMFDYFTRNMPAK